MLKNYFTVAWRSLSNNKAFSLINIFGLALGMACSLLIFLWINDERSMDNFHANGSRLYILYEQEHIDGKMMSGYWTPGLLGRGPHTLRQKRALLLRPRPVDHREAHR